MKSIKDLYLENRKTSWIPSYYYQGNIRKRERVTTARQALMAARHAIESAKLKAQFESMGGEIVDDAKQLARLPDESTVAIVAIADDCCNLDDLLGDTYTAGMHDEYIKPEKLKEERQAEIDRINRDGVWGFASYFKDPVTNEWEQAEWFCSGFVGKDFIGSGYDDDAMRDAIEHRLEREEETASLNQFSTELETV